MAGIKQRRAYANYLNVGNGSPEYVLCGAGFTELNENPSAKTVSKRYVHEKSETKSIVGYDWSTAFNTDMIREEKAVDFICNIGEKQLIGADAETDYIIVDLDKPVSEKDDTYEARQINIAIEVASFDNNDGEMAASGNFLGRGDIVLGEFNIKSGTFTTGE